MKKKATRAKTNTSKSKSKKKPPNGSTSNSGKKNATTSSSSTPKMTILKIKEYENEIVDKFKSLYEKLSKNEYNDKPEYLNITSSPYISEDDLKVLNKLSMITKFKLISNLEILYKSKYEEHNKISNEKDKCSICQFNFYEDEEDDKKKEELFPFDSYLKKDINVILLDKCADHFFHIECLSMLIGDKDNFKCPNCSMIYGILIGDMPYGTMTAYISKNTHCDGYKSNGTIIIDYYFPNGNNYTGTMRECYLPDTKEGREVLALLKVAFDRKLSFTIGTSVTTGQTNTTVWNGIHHKTNTRGGPTRFGYPDPTYFSRVQEELAVKGVTKDSIDEDLQDIAENLINNS